MRQPVGLEVADGVGLAGDGEAAEVGSPVASPLGDGRCDGEEPLEALAPTVGAGEVVSPDTSSPTGSSSTSGRGEGAAASGASPTASLSTALICSSNSSSR